MNISIIVPVYNEEENIESLYATLIETLRNIDVVDLYEVIFVDDGSTDQTYSKLKSINNNKVNVIRLKKNMKKTAALHTGFKEAMFEIIATLDADLQYDPLDIREMLKKIEEGYDCVCGWRYNRVDPFIKKISSKIANYIRKFALKDNFHDMGCGMIVFRRECINNIEFFNGAHRFLPSLVQIQGYRVIEHRVKHKARKFGKSKYNIHNRIFETLSNLIYIRKMAKNRKNDFIKTL